MKINYFKFNLRSFSNLRHVPSHIPRPEYAITGEPFRSEG